MISHHHRCIFIHIPKNAGQSIETVFLNILGLTWKTRAPLLLRENDIPELGPPRLAHLTANDYVNCKYLPQDTYDAYFKFAFTRNPWTRAVSFYKYMGKGSGKNFREFIKEDFFSGIYKKKYWFVMPQTEYILDTTGNQIVDFVGKFETLQDDFNLVCERIGIPPTSIPHANNSTDRSPSKRKQIKLKILGALGKVSNVENHPNTSDYYDDETVALIGDLYRTDIEHFGYQFPA